MKCDTDKIVYSENNLHKAFYIKQVTYFSRGTIFVISFSLLISSSLQGAHREPIIPTTKRESCPMSSAPFSACC